MPHLATRILPALAALSTLTFLLSQTNGFLPQLLSLESSSHPFLPSSPNSSPTNAILSLKNHWTGIKPIDKLCVQFIAFFWPVINGENVALTVQGVHFLGQGYVVWMLLLVEGWRAGNRGKLVSL